MTLLLSLSLARALSFSLSLFLSFSLSLFLSFSFSLSLSLSLSLSVHLSLVLSHCLSVLCGTMFSLADYNVVEGAQVLCVYTAVAVPSPVSDPIEMAPLHVEAKKEVAREARPYRPPRRPFSERSLSH